MKFLSADLLADTTVTYDQTKTTLYGRAQSHIIDGDTAIGPPLNKFVDVFTEMAFTPSPSGMYLTQNGRLFHISTFISGIATISLHNFNIVTGQYTAIGKINITLPNNAVTTHTVRSLKVYDNDPSAMKIAIQTTGSVATNGGLFIANNVNITDFTMVLSVTLLMATSTNQKAIYFYQRTTEMGPQNLMTSGTGMVLDYDAASIYFHNGVSATHQYYKFDLSVAPSVDGTFTGASVSAASPAVAIVTGHTYVNDSRIIFTSGTLPTGLSLNTVYYVRGAATNTFNLSLTAGGANINTTGTSGSGLTVMRAFGESNSAFVLKTGNLPALLGTLLNSDSEDFAVPQHGPVSTLGQDCAFLATSTNLYLGKLSDLANASTAWSSLSTVNLLGTSNQIIAPTVTLSTWSNILDGAVYIANGSIFVYKKFINNQINVIFGGSNNRYLEAMPNIETIELQALAYGALDVESGYLVATGTTLGQRGSYISDLRSDINFNYSHIITKVLSTNGGTAKFITTLDKIFDYTGGLEVYYRTSGFATDLGGWTPIDFATDLSAISIIDEIQFDIYFTTIGLDTSIPAQLVEFILGYEPLSEMSSKWKGSVENSSREGETPFKTAFRMVVSDSGKKYFRAYDDTNTLVHTANTDDDFANFDYSTDNGSTWTPFASANDYPSTILTTEIRYRWSASPSAGTKLTVSLRDA
jgi:hypothetical protein